MNTTRTTSRRSYPLPVLILLLSIFAAKLLLTRVQDPPIESSLMSYDGSRGWPWVFSRSVKNISPEFTSQPGVWIRSSFSWSLLLADLAVLTIALVVAGLLLRRRYRRLGRLLQFSLGEMLVLVTIVAVACGWLSLRYRQWRLERQTFASFPDGMFGIEDGYRGPEWLRRILPGDRLTVFHCTVELSPEMWHPGDATASSLVRALASAPYVRRLCLQAPLAGQLTNPAPFVNIDEVYLSPGSNTADIDSALTQIARWPALRNLTIEGLHSTLRAVRLLFGNSEKAISIAGARLLAFSQTRSFRPRVLLRAPIAHIKEARSEGFASRARRSVQNGNYL